MNYFDYSVVNREIRPDLPEAYRQAWQMIAKPGNWWTGQDRVAIAAETRNAWSCEYCAKCKAALSPYSVDGEHSSVTNLPPAAIDAIHRLVTDASRLTESWLQSIHAQGVTDDKYIELMGIVVTVVSIDAFHRALGLPIELLPEPEVGEPSGYRPPGATDMGAWVPMVPPTAVTEAEADLYDGNQSTYNFWAAMSLVPDTNRMLKTLRDAQYLPLEELANPIGSGGRAISRSQIEFVAARVSSFNDCFF